MSINNTGIKRRPTHPGEMLREDFLPDYELTISGLAEAIGVSRQSINELLRERRAVSPEMAFTACTLLRKFTRVLVECTTGSRSMGRSTGDREGRSQNPAN